MRTTVREYLPAVLKVWWAMTVFVISDGIGVYSVVTSHSLSVPAWVWLVVGTGFLFVAQFVAFHRVRVQRDLLTFDVEDALHRLSDFSVTIGGTKLEADTILKRIWMDITNHTDENQMVSIVRQRFQIPESTEIYDAVHSMLVQMRLCKIVDISTGQRFSGQGRYEVDTYKLSDFGTDVVRYMNKEKKEKKDAKT
jgi:hypothetical protein